MALDASTKHQRTMMRIQRLLAIADDPAATPAEAETARSQADALMFRYKIEALTEPEQVSLINPEWRTYWITRSNSTWSNFYSGIAQQVFRHNGILFATKYQTDHETGHRWLTYEAVGFGADLQYAEMLISSAIAAFGAKIEPKVNPDETPGQNALRLRQGGMERHRIATALFGPSETENEQKGKNRKVTALIKAECIATGRMDLISELLGRGGASIKTYRESYANGFYWTLNQRITALSTERAQSGEGTLVLASWKERLEEALYERFPHMRPRKEEHQIAGPSVSDEQCKKCAKAKSGYCREHSWKRPRYSSRQRAWSSAGQRAGSNAARTVDLGGTRGSITG